MGEKKTLLKWNLNIKNDIFHKKIFNSIDKDNKLEWNIFMLQ